MTISKKHPNYGRTSPGANLDYLNKWAQDQTFEHGAFDVVGQFLAAMNAGTDVNVEVAAFAKALAQRVTYSKDQTAAAHDEVARKMQRVTKTAFLKAQAESPRSSVPSYREGGGPRRRDAGGKLLGCIASKDFYRATPNGIGFINTTLMDSRARQWHRLNFGARPAGQYTPTRYEVRFGSLVAGAFGFFDEEPSAGFGLPEGGAFNAQRQFFGPRGKQVFPTKGIRAWNFLDAGVEEMSVRIGPAYEGLYNKWFESAYVKGKGPLSRVVDPPRPRRGAFRPI